MDKIFAGKELPSTTLINGSWVAVKETELTETEKQKYWQTTISGSQLRRLLDSPVTLYEEKVFGKKMFFSDHILAAMAFGTEMESKIVEHLPKDLPYKIKVDKRTFIPDQEENQRLSCNIDGFLIDKESEETIGIFEAKCLKSGLIEQVKKDYYPQIQYYLWFFALPFAVLGFFNKETNLYSYLKIDADRDYQSHLMDQVFKFITQHWLAKIPPKLIVDPNEAIDLRDENDDDFSTVFMELGEIKAQIKILENKAKEIEQEIKQNLPPKVNLVIGDQFKYSLVDFSKSVCDWKGFRHAMELKYNNGLAFQDFEQRFTKSRNVSYWKLTIKKGEQE